MSLSVAPTIAEKEQEPLPPKHNIRHTIERYVENIYNTLWYWPKSDVFRIAKIEEKSEQKKADLDYFDLWKGNKLVYIDGTFFLYTKVDDQANKGIRILHQLKLQEPGVEPSLSQKALISDPQTDSHYIGFTFFQEPKNIYRSQDIPMLIVRENQIVQKTMLIADSSTSDPIIEVKDNTFQIKTEMWLQQKYQYYNPITQTYTESAKKEEKPIR